MIRSHWAFRNWLLLGLALAASGWLLFGGPLRDKSNAAREEVVLWHFWGGTDLEVVRDVVRRFNAAQSDYFVREVAMPGNNLRAKLFLSAAGGAPPDLVNIDDPVIADWEELGLLRTVAEIAGRSEADRIAQSLFPAARELSSSAGQLVGICNGLDVRALYYNRTFLEERGWKAPQTLEELDEIGWKVRALELDQPRFAFLPPPRRILFFAHLFGAQVWDPEHARPCLDSSPLVQAAEWLQSYSRLYGDDQVAAYRQTDQSLPGKSFPLLPQTAEQMTGRYLFSLDGQWRVRDLRAFRAERLALGKPQPEFDVMPFPPPARLDDSARTAPAGWVNGNVFVFPRRARNSTGALAFAKFWIGLDQPAEAAQTCLAGGWIPVLPKVVAEPSFAAELEREPLFRRFVELAESSGMRPTPSVRGAAYLVRVLESTAERVASDSRLPADGAFGEANRELETYFSKLPRRPNRRVGP
ncbi:MAG: extracellular solute-binding protein [Planctomycetota bacterium]